MSYMKAFYIFVYNRRILCKTCYTNITTNITPFFMYIVHVIFQFFITSSKSEYQNDNYKKTNHAKFFKN